MAAGAIPSGVVALSMLAAGVFSLVGIGLGFLLVGFFSLLGAWLGNAWGKRILEWKDGIERLRGGELPALPVGPALEWEEFRACWDKLRDKTKRIFETQKEFTANAAHELRTPLTALRLTGEHLFQGNQGLTEMRDTVGAMLEEAARLDRLVDQLLMLARADSGRIGIEADYLSLHEVVDEVVEVREVLAADRGQKIELNMDGQWSVWADKNLLRLAFDNLLANAIRHSPRNSKIGIRIRRRAEGGVAVEVRDAGPGLTKGEEEAVFERFYRGSGSVPGEGFGLGLPISRWAVEAFGGNLSGQNTSDGSGALFTLLCPETEWDHFAGSAEKEEEGGWQNVELEWAVDAAPGQVLAKMESSPKGLAEKEADRRRSQVGANRFRTLLEQPFGYLFRQACQTPFNGILLICLFLSLLLGEVRPAMVMGLMVVLSTGLRFWQERRSHEAARALEKMVAVTAAVARPEVPGGTKQVPVENLVPGDVVHLTPGDMVPADLRLLSAQGLEISETTFTGESFPVSKTARSLPSGEDSPKTGESANLCYLGTHVVRGGGIGVILKTGRRTRMGRSSTQLYRPAPESDFQRGVRHVSWLLLSFMAALVPTVLLLNGLFLGNWTEALLFALAVAVGLTPELLPVMVNVNLARAARTLARRGLIIKNLSAVHSLGAMDVLCMDKTGTLTQDEPQLTAVLDGRGIEAPQILTMAALNARWEGSLHGPLDQEILRRADTLPQGVKRGEVPFDHDRKVVSVIWQADGNKKNPLLICKGAAEVVLEHCTQWLDKEQIRELSHEDRELCIRQLEALQRQGGRVIGVATKELRKTSIAWGKKEEREMTFLGFLVFQDPLKEGVQESLRQLIELGVRPLLLTGDHPAPALAAASAAGLPSGSVVVGNELEKMPEMEARRVLAEASVLARLTPLDKARVVRLLRMNGHRVGFLGDGANDANALREADVGVVTRSGADLAKATGEIIITGKDLSVLGEGIREGRIAFGNILKYIKITASSNFGNAFSVVLASLVLPFLPMRAVQLLVQNLLYDLLQFCVPWDRVDRDFRDRPRPWSADSVGRFMLVFGPLSSVFDLATFAFLWFIVGANSVADQAIFQSGWFLVGILTQVFIFFVLRTGGLPFWVERASPPVALAGILVAGVALILPWTPLGAWFGFVSLPPWYLLWVGIILLSYGTSAQIAKVLYRRKCGSWW